MHSRPLSDIDYQRDIGVVLALAQFVAEMKYMIITASRDFDIFVCHPDVFGIDFQIIWCSHDNELYGFLISKRFIRPIYTLISYTEDIREDNYHFRMERISLTAAIPLFAINTLVMTV